MSTSDVYETVDRLLPFLKKVKLWWQRRAATIIVRKELPVLIKAIEPLISTSRSCGLYSFAKERNKDQQENNYRLEELIHAVNILGNLYRILYARAQKWQDICLSDLDELGYMLLGVKDIFVRIIQLIDEETTKKFKMDPYAYPVFKKQYEDVALKLKDLTVKVGKQYGDQNEWHHMALPEL